MVTDASPLNVTRVRVPGTTFAEYSWRATVTSSKVTDWLPKTLEKRNRIRLPHRSGLTMERNVCSVAPNVLAVGKGKARSG